MAAFESLRHRDYRRVLLGSVLSNVGTWMQIVTLSWHVLQITRSAFWVGAVSFANFIPMWLTPLGGVLADRVDRRRILIVTQSLMMAGVLALALLATAGRATLVPVLLIALWEGLVLAFDAPARHTFVPSLVPRESMVNAIALNSAQFSLARVIGPAIAGGLIASVGVVPVFWINALSFLAVLVALWLVRRRPATVAQGGPRRPLGHLLEGLRYVRAHPAIRLTIVSVAVISLFGASLFALLPVFAEEVFRQGPRGFGILAASMGAGSVVGALALGTRGTVSPSTVGGGLVATALILAAFASVTVFAAGLALVFLFGGTYLFTVASGNSGIQTTVDERVRGRVLSLFTLAFGGLFPIGSLVAGALADAVGPQTAARLAAGACLVCGLGVLWWSRRSPEPGLSGAPGA